MEQQKPIAVQDSAPISASHRTAGRLRIVVNLNRCQGYAQCCFMAPDVFQLHGDEALLYNPEPDREQYQAILRAIAACPVQAIEVEQVDVSHDVLEKG